MLERTVRRTVACPLCAGTDLRDRGAILHPASPMVAGVPIDLGDAEFHLRACAACGFAFKDPPIPDAKLIDCYARGPKVCHRVDDPRARRFDVVERLLSRHAPGRTVLDVGCFDGSFLRYLPSEWQKYGVEPGVEPAQAAREAGVTILGGTLEDARDGWPRVHAVVVIDVVEHIADPLRLFEQVRDRLLPGGICVVVTGDTAAWTWRVEGSRYWYCSLPGHLSFFSRRAMQHLGGRLGMESVEHFRLSHVRSPLARRVTELAKNLGYVAGRAVGGLGLPPLRRLFMERRAPDWGTARDHMFHVLRRAG